MVSLPAHLIGPRDGGRPIDTGKIKQIAESIREVGLLSPIVVAPGKRIRNGVAVDGWDILAGQHRFKAMHTILNWQEIPCLVHDGSDLHAELVMIDENLMRHDLSPAQLAHQTARRKEIYEALHPETVHGVAGSTARWNAVEKISTAFATETAKATGRHERTVRMDATRGRDLGEDLKLIKGTSLDKGNELEALRRMPQPDRRELIDRAHRGEKVSAVKLAKDPVTDMEASELQVAKLMDAWNAAGPDAREEFMLRVNRSVAA